MTLRELVEKADDGYTESFPESSLLEQVDEQGMPLDPPNKGDTLALFVVRELHETYDSDLTDRSQLQEAIRALEKAKDTLQATIETLEGHLEDLQQDV